MLAFMSAIGINGLVCYLEFCRDRAVAMALKKKRPVGREPDGSFAPPAFKTKTALTKAHSASRASQVEGLDPNACDTGRSINDAASLAMTDRSCCKPFPAIHRPGKQLKRRNADQDFGGTVDVPSNRPNL